MTSFDAQSTTIRRLGGPQRLQVSFPIGAGGLALGRGEPEGAIDTADVAGLTVRQSRAMASARKPVIVRKFSRDWCAGYAGAEFGQQKADL